MRSSRICGIIIVEVDSGVARPSFFWGGGGRSERHGRLKNFSRKNLFSQNSQNSAFPHSQNCVAFSYDTE